MIVLVARYHVQPGRRQEVEDLLKKMALLVREREPGCREYQASRSADDPDLLLLYEHYTDTAALEGHRTTAHFREIIEGKIMPMLVKRERELYELAVSWEHGTKR